MGKFKISNNSLMVKEVRDILEEINKVGVSILLVEHNIKVAMSLAGRV
jgi:branched-chain amino acid transport system ATP-binding protein